jgi:quercetin dioxygenase-like cupin family protein
MSTQRASGFPARIRSLPPFEGAFDAFRLAAEGCDVLIASYPPGAVIEPHTHETENCGVVTRGAMVLTLEGSERRIGAGEWYRVPQGAVHAARFDEPTEQIEFWFAT